MSQKELMSVWIGDTESAWYLIITSEFNKVLNNYI